MVGTTWVLGEKEPTYLRLYADYHRQITLIESMGLGSTHRRFSPGIYQNSSGNAVKALWFIELQSQAGTPLTTSDQYNPAYLRSFEAFAVQTLG